MATTEERLAALEAKMAQLMDTRPTTYYMHQYSGEEIDAATGRALTGGALDTSVTNVSNQLGTFVRPNIFDNPDYCINQRWTTEIASANGYYTDRWRKYGLAATGTVERGLAHIISDGSTTCGWVQRFEASRLIAGETYTFSVLFKVAKASDVKMSYGDKLDSLSGTKVIADVNTPLDTWDLATFTFVLPQSGDGNYNFRVRSAAVEGEYYIGPAKLELGPTQTLAHQDSAGNWVLNEVPEYGGQLRRCRWYCKVYKAGEYLPCIAFALEDGWYCCAMLPYEMRAKPANNIGSNISVTLEPLLGGTGVETVLENYGTLDGVQILKFSKDGQAFKNASYYRIKLNADLILTADL